MVIESRGDGRGGRDDDVALASAEGAQDYLFRGSPQECFARFVAIELFTAVGVFDGLAIRRPEIRRPPARAGGCRDDPSARLDERSARGRGLVGGLPRQPGAVLGRPVTLRDAAGAMVGVLGGVRAALGLRRGDDET